MNKQGFSLIELMVVVAIVAFLAKIAVPHCMRFLAKSKRAEAYLNLGSLYTAQKIYFAENGTYANALSGADSLGWKPDGQHQYTYGFAGQEGVNYVKGELPASLEALSQAQADQKGFKVVAIADIDGDGNSDIIVMDDKHNLTIVQDDLAD